jgi:uncharacterized protein (TIGR00251 family)
MLKLVVHVQPNARTSGVAGLHGDALKIRVAAPAVDDKANAAVLELLTALLGVPLTNATLLTGRHSRRKVVQVRQAVSAVVETLLRIDAEYTQRR